jgi:hypothetical protein
VCLDVFFGGAMTLLPIWGLTTMMTLVSLFGLVVIGVSFAVGGRMLGKALASMGGNKPAVYEKGQRVIKTSRIIIVLIALLLFWSLIYTIFGGNFSSPTISDLKIIAGYGLMNTCTFFTEPNFVYADATCNLICREHEHAPT